MSVFCYTRHQIRLRKRGPIVSHTVERTFRIGKAPTSITVRGKRYLRDIAAEWAGRRIKNACWPMKSDALGVLDSQTDEAAKHLADSGVPTEFTKDGTGRCIVKSRGHRNRVMAVLGIHDRDAGYGDRARP